MNILGQFCFNRSGKIPAAVAAGGYDNLNNWPSAVNRPTNTSTMSWIGPVGGGASTANDVSQSRVLTPSGTVTSSADGQIIEGLDITGRLNVFNPSCLVRQCRIRINAGTALGDFGNALNVDGAGSVIEDCVIGATVIDHQNGISMGWTAVDTDPRVILRRCHIFGFDNFIVSGSNFDVIDCWFHQATYPAGDSDMMELYGNPPTGHSDGVVIRHNTFDGQDKSGGFLNAGVNMTDLAGPIGDVHPIQLDNNAFLGTFDNIAICDGVRNGHSVSFTATNNGFYNCAFRLGEGTCTPNSGNFVMANQTAISGSLCNGTGII